MSTFLRRAGFATLVLCGVLAGHGVARAQFAFGMTRYGLNLTNPFVAQQQYMNQLAMGRLAIASGQAVPAALPYLAPYMAPPVNPYMGPAFNPYMASGYNPYLASGYNPYMYGANPYTTGSGYGANPYTTGSGYGSNPYSTGSGYGSNPYSSNPYSTGSAASYLPYYSPYSNPALGPGYTLMGGADVMRAYGNVITSQEQARLLRQQYYQAKLDTQKKQFDLDRYIKENTPTFNEIQAKIAKQTLKRIQTNSNPAEVVDGRSLNYLLDDIDKYRGKTMPEVDLPPDALTHINVKPAGADSNSLGLLRSGGKLSWPSALVDLLSPTVRKDMDAAAQSVAQAALEGKEPDRNALKDLRIQIESAQNQLVKKANDYGTSEYMDAKRFLNDLETARRAIDRGNARAQAQFQQLVKNGKINTLNDLVRVMTENGWRFGPALPADEATYRSLHSGLAAYDIALNQLVAQAEQ